MTDEAAAKLRPGETLVVGGLPEGTTWASPVEGVKLRNGDRLTVADPPFLRLLNPSLDQSYGRAVCFESIKPELDTRYWIWPEWIHRTESNEESSTASFTCDSLDLFRYGCRCQ